MKVATICLINSGDYNNNKNTYKLKTKYETATTTTITKTLHAGYIARADNNVIYHVLSTVSDPDVPTLVTVSNVQQTRAELEWNIGDTYVVNMTIVHYVDVSTSSWQTTSSINMLTDLTPGRTYVFYLQVHSFDKSARSANCTFTISEFLAYGMNK